MTISKRKRGMGRTVLAFAATTLATKLAAKAMKALKTKGLRRR